MQRCHLTLDCDRTVLFLADLVAWLATCVQDVGCRRTRARAVAPLARLQRNSLVMGKNKPRQEIWPSSEPVFYAHSRLEYCPFKAILICVNEKGSLSPSISLVARPSISLSTRFLRITSLLCLRSIELFWMIFPRPNHFGFSGIFDEIRLQSFRLQTNTTAISITNTKQYRENLGSFLHCIHF